MARKGFSRLEHTADEYIMAYGRNLEEAFESAALAMFEVMTDTNTIEHNMQELIEIQAPDEESLLYAWLERLLFEFDAEEKIFSMFKVGKIERTEEGFTLKAVVLGDRYHPKKHPSRTGVKAITYHLMEIIKEKNRVIIKFLLDI